MRSAMPSPDLARRPNAEAARLVSDAFLDRLLLAPDGDILILVFYRDLRTICENDWSLALRMQLALDGWYGRRVFGARRGYS